MYECKLFDDLKLKWTSDLKYCLDREAGYVAHLDEITFGSTMATFTSKVGEINPGLIDVNGLTQTKRLTQRDTKCFKISATPPT